MPGLDPGIHDELRRRKPYGCHCWVASWIAGSSPAMTAERLSGVDKQIHDESRPPFARRVYISHPFARRNARNQSQNYFLNLPRTQKSARAI